MQARSERDYLLNDPRADNDQHDDGASLLCMLAPELIEMILYQLPLSSVMMLASANRKTYNIVMQTRSPYRLSNHPDSRGTYYQVAQLLKREYRIKKRLHEIETSRQEGCYDAPIEDRPGIHNVEAYCISMGGIVCALTVCASIGTLFFAPPIIPLSICLGGSLTTACTAGVGGTSRYYTNRFDREDKEVAALKEEFTQIQSLAEQITVPLRK